MPRPFQALVVNNFAGENDTLPSSEIADNQGDLVQNLYLVNGGLERRLGTLKGAVGNSGQECQALLWCRIPATSPKDRLYQMSQGELFECFNGNGVFPAINTLPTQITDPNSGATGILSAVVTSLDMAVVDNKVYIADGTNPMIRADGTAHYSQSGLAAPTTAPTFNAFVGAGVLTGNVTYVVTYLDKDGNESEASAASAVLTPAAQNVTLNIPNDADARGFRSGKNLYRLGVASTVYKLVNSSPIATGATTYTDSVTDANLGAQLVQGNTLMPSCAHLWEHDGRLFGCGNVALPKTLFISNQFQPWYCPSSPNVSDPTQGVRLQIQGSNSVIVGGISHGGYCFIFTDEGGYILQGTTQDDYRIERFTNHGCTSHRSIRTLRNWLFWVGPDGIYRYDGINVQRIDYPIRTFFRSLTNAVLASACGWIYDDRYYLSFNATGSCVKCFDTRYSPQVEYVRMDQATATTQVWTTMRYNGGTHWGSVTTSQSVGGTAGVTTIYACSGSANTSNVMQLEAPGQYTDDKPGQSGTDAIWVQWVSKQFNMGLPGRDKRVQLWGCKFRNPVLPASSDGSVVSSWIFTSGSPSTSAGTAAQAWDESISAAGVGEDWGSAPQAGNDITVVRQEGVEQLRSELFQLNINTISTTISDFRLVSAELYYTMAG